MGKLSRDKGARREREIVEAHRKIGVRAERVPLSGAMAFRNTRQSYVDVYARGADAAPFVTEVKARAGGEGFVTLERWLGENDAFFLVPDREAPLVVLPWARWVEILGSNIMHRKIHPETQKAISGATEKTVAQGVFGSQT